MKPIFLVLLYPFLIFGQTQNDQCKIPINDLDLKMNVNTFFIDKIIKDDNTQYNTEYGSTLSATEAFKKYKQTQKVAKTNLPEADLDKKHLLEGDEKINIAQLYSIVRYVEDDRLVCYQNIWFPTFKVLSTMDDKFVALIAENRKVAEEDFKVLIGNLEKTNKLSKTDSQNFETYSFDFKTYELKFKKAKTSYRSESSIQLAGEDKDKPKKTVDLELIILSKSASDKHLNWLNKNYGK